MDRDDGVVPVLKVNTEVEEDGFEESPILGR